MGDNGPGGEQAPKFDVVPRGYERAQVEAVVAEVTGGGTPAAVPAFDVVPRGYERRQVDDWIAANLASAPVPAPGGPPQEEPLIPGLGPWSPAFDVVLRGYERRQVDELTRRVLGTIDGDPSAGPPVTREQLRKDGLFRVVLRGYERAQVDAWLNDHADRLPE